MLQLTRRIGSSPDTCALALLAVLGLAPVPVSAQGSTQLRTFAGVSPAGHVNGTGGAARFNVPTSIAVDSAGALYVTDTHNCYIRKITPDGTVTGFAGNIFVEPPCGSGDGAGNVAQFSFPQGIAVDSAGTVYVADTFNHTIRKITPAGAVSTLAGQAGVAGTVDGTGGAARFTAPRGLAVDSAGTLYVADSNHVIRQVTALGVVTTLAGSANTAGTSDGTGSAARFNAPRGLAVDSTGAVYVADSNSHTIRKITAGGVVTTFAGLAGTPGNTNGTGTAARFSSPRGVAVDSAGTLYVADTNSQRIRQITAAAVVTTFAGSGQPGGADGTGSGARFNNPEGVAVDGSGTVYVADTTSDTIRKISSSAVVTTLAGFVGSLGSADGVGPAARFAYPFGVATDTNGIVYVADRTNHTIRKITPAAEVTTFAGLADVVGNTDGTGSAARFNAPRAVAVDGAGTVYVADTNNHTIQTITPAGVVSTLAGLAGSSGSADGTGSVARFNTPSGIAVDGAGTLYVADGNNHTIRKIAPGGIVTTLAGSAGLSGSTDGTGSAARFNFPRGVAVDTEGTVYVADTNNNTIRQITSAGVVSTLAGLAPVFAFADGTGSAARFGGPQGIAVDDDTSTLYVADTGNHVIRKITTGAVVTTISGCPGCIGTADWGRFNQPLGIALNAQGSLYVADSRNNTIRTTAPNAMALVVDFGPSFGIWMRRGSAWSQVHSLTAESMLRVRGGLGDLLAIDFGPGVGLWVREEENDGAVFWFQLHSLSPTKGVALDLDGDGNVESGVFDFPGQGLWRFDGNNGEWFPLHGLGALHLVAANLDGVGGDELIVDFPGLGLWVYGNGGWSQLHGLDVTAIMAGDLDGNGSEDLVANFPGFGVWSYRTGPGWSQVHGFAATRFAAGDLDHNGMTDLVIDFGAVYGVWTLRNGTTWGQLHGLTTEGISVGDLDNDGYDEVIIDFGGAGVWSYEDGGGWQPVHSFNPKGMVTGRF